MHADYFSIMKSRIRVFTDRIEFLNPGALPQSLEKIRAGDLSLPRNPIIAKLFRMVNLAENAGYGFDKMEAGWAQYSDAKPVFEQGVDFTKAEFYFSVKGGQKGGLKGGQKGGQKMLTTRQKEVLELINSNPLISRQEMAKVLSMNISALRKHLDALRQKGFIEREGPNKGGYWKLLIE
jgi:ATP-dependent DNA helicase RecG